MWPIENQKLIAMGTRYIEKVELPEIAILLHGLLKTPTSANLEQKLIFGSNSIYSLEMYRVAHKYSPLMETLKIDFFCFSSDIVRRSFSSQEKSYLFDYE